VVVPGEEPDNDTGDLPAPASHVRHGRIIADMENVILY